MRRVLALDPGSFETGWVVYEWDSDLEHIVDCGTTPNDELLEALHLLDAWPELADDVVVEWTAPRGMPASAQLFETLFWAGRLAEAIRPRQVARVERDKVKENLLGRRNGKDSALNAAIWDRFGGIGGRGAAVGRKAAPGPLYGVTGDAMAALAVAITYADQLEGRAE